MMLSLVRLLVAGNLDIVLAKGRHWPLVDRVLLGDGTGGIRESFDLGVASDKSYPGRLVDLDGDGVMDLLVPHRNGGQSRLYFGARNADLTHLRSVPFGPADARIRGSADPCGRGGGLRR